MLFTKDAVQMIGLVLAQKLADYPDGDWAKGGLALFLTRIESGAKREGYTVVTAANVLDQARRMGYREGERG